MHQKKCPHMQPVLSSHSPFASSLKQTMKGWICLKDGCYRKTCTRQELKQQLSLTSLSRFQNGHRIFMECGKLEIYCFQCDREIQDEEQFYQGDKDKEKDLIKGIRKMVVQVDKEQQKILFGANKEYSEGFWKEKVGLAGLFGTEITGYINAVIQLLAHTSPFYQIVQDIELSMIRNPCLRQVFQIITKIRSGVYRIIETKKVQQKLFKTNPNFLKYSHKTPSNFLFQLLREFSQQFEYTGPQCKSGQILSILQSPSASPPKQKYSPMKNLFAGSFNWQVRCPKCLHEKVLKIQFQCIRLEHTNPSQQPKLQLLIESAFDFHKILPEVYNNKCQRNDCKTADQKQEYQIIQEKSFINLPNILLLEFMADQGMQVSYPDAINLSKIIKNLPSQNGQFIFQYIGSVAKLDKKYYTHIRQKKDPSLSNPPRQLSFNQTVICEQAQKPQKLSLALYKIQPLLRNRNISKNIQSSVIVGIDCYVPLPDFWNWYVMELLNVQVLVNPYICRHGLLRPNVRGKVKEGKTRKIPWEVYQYLVEEFGGQSVRKINGEEFCGKCLERLQLILELKQSQKQMAKFADQLSSKKSKACIDLEWFQKWKRYLYGDVDIEGEGKGKGKGQAEKWSKLQNGYESQGYRRPGVINNKRGLGENGEIDESKYKKVSPQVWYFFKKFYGGGPLIAKNLTPPSLALTQAVDLRFQRIKKIIQILEQK